MDLSSCRWLLNCEFETHRSGLEGIHVAGTPQHLVDLVEMQFFLDDHLAGVFLKQHRFPGFCELQQFIIGIQRRLLVLQAFPQDIADVVLLRFEQRTDLQLRVSAQQRDHFSGPLGVGQSFRGIALHPADDGNPVVAVDHQGIVRVTHHPGQLQFHDLVQDLDGLFGVFLFRLWLAGSRDHLLADQRGIRSTRVIDLIGGPFQRAQIDGPSVRGIIFQVLVWSEVQV